MDLCTSVPPLPEFSKLLHPSCQLWILSGNGSCQLSKKHIKRIVKYVVHEKKGLFLWGENDPFNVEANAVLAELPMFQGPNKVELQGNFMGDTVLTESTSAGAPGFKNHLVTTGLQSVYEGITVAAVVGKSSSFRTLIRSSDSKTVTAIYDRDGCRIAIDGGYTRLYPAMWTRRRVPPASSPTVPAGYTTTSTG